MKKKEIKAILVLISGIVLIGLAGWGYFATSQKQEIIKRGIVQQGVVLKIYQKRTFKTLLVQFNGKEIGAEVYGNDYNNKGIGDIISFYYVPQYERIVPIGLNYKGDYIYSLIALLFGIFSIIVGFLSLFVNEKQNQK